MSTTHIGHEHTKLSADDPKVAMMHHLVEAASRAADDGHEPNIERYLRLLGLRDDDAVEAQAHRVPAGGYEMDLFGCFTSDTSLLAAIAEADIGMRAARTCLLINELRRPILTRASLNRWHSARENADAEDTDILARRAFYITFEPRVGLAGEAAMAAVRDAAFRCFADLAFAIGGPASLGIGFSGRGFQVHVALDHLANDGASSEAIKAIILAAKAAYSDARVSVATTTWSPRKPRWGAKLSMEAWEPRVLAPAWGTTVRLGAEDAQRTWFFSEESVERVAAPVLAELASTFGSAR